MFIHLHWHSHYSLLKAIWEPKKIVEKAKSLNMPAIALTDYDNLYWAIEFYEYCIKNEIKPIIWTELSFTFNYNNLKFSKNIETNYITLLAKSYTWYKNLIKLISIAQTKGLYQNIPYIDINILKEFSKDIFIILGWLYSRIWKLIKNSKNLDLIAEYIKKFTDIFWKDNILIEIQPQKIDTYKNLNRHLRDLAKKLNLLVIVNNNFHYISKEDKDALGILKAIDKNDFYNPLEHNPIEEQHIMSEEEIKQLLTEYPFISIDILNNNKIIAENINIEIPLWQILFPKYEVKRERQEIYNKYKNQLIDTT